MPSIRPCFHLSWFTHEKKTEKEHDCLAARARQGGGSDGRHHDLERLPFTGHLIGPFGSGDIALLRCSVSTAALQTNVCLIQDESSIYLTDRLTRWSVWIAVIKSGHHGLGRRPVRPSHPQLNRSVTSFPLSSHWHCCFAAPIHDLKIILTQK